MEEWAVIYNINYYFTSIKFDLSLIVSITCQFFDKRAELKHNEQRRDESKTAIIKKYMIYIPTKAEWKQSHTIVNYLNIYGKWK